VKPTFVTLKMALASGDFELVRLVWDRLPEVELCGRLEE
jgi:hypothetical protein